MKKLTLLLIILVSTFGFSQPTTNPSAPTNAAVDVVSIYGDTFSNIAINYDPNWGQSGHTQVNANYDPGTGISVLAYPNFNYQGTELTQQSAAGMEFLHIDIWTSASPAATDIQVSPINNLTGVGETLVSIAYNSGTWTSVDIPKSAFTGMTWDRIFQIKFAANGAGSTVPVDIYLDNIYFWKNPVAAPIDDATLGVLQVDGVPVAGFDPATTDYTAVASSSSSIPQITLATPNSDQATSTVITQATDLFEDATVVVTAEDGSTTQTYRVTIGILGSTVIQDFENSGTTIVTPPGIIGDNGTLATVVSSPGGATGNSLSLESTSTGLDYQAGIFSQVSDLVVLTPINNTVKVDVYSSSTQDFYLRLKLEDGGSPIERTQTYDGSFPNTWQTLTYDFGSVNATYSKIVFFLNSNSTNNGFVTARDFTAIIDNISLSSVRTERLAYTYQAGSWTPQNPDGISTAIDNMLVMDGIASVNGAVEVNDLEIASGAVLEVDNGDVSVASNLVNNGAITGSDQVILNSANADVTGTGTMTNLTVGATGSVTMIGSQSIIEQLDILSGGTLNANGNITLVSNAMGTARVDEMDAGAIVGDVNVERYIPAGNRAYRFIGPTVSGQTVFNSWQEAGNNAVGLGVQVTGTAGTAGVANATSGHDETATGAASMFKWDAAGQAWTTVANTNTEVLNAGAYYRLFVRGDRTTDLSNNAAAQTATKLRASGSLMQTSMVVTPGIANGEFFVVANPYQSKVSMATTASGTAADMYYWDSNLGMNGSYATIGISSGVGTAGMATNVLDAGQAVFFVDASAAASVTIAQTNKVSGNNNAGVFSTNTLQQALRLKLYQTSRYNNNQSESDGLYIDFDAAHNVNVDSNDAVKLNGLNVNMAISKSTGEMLAVERRKLPTSAEIINLNISNYLTSNYTMVAVVDVLPGLTAYLKDNFNGNMTELVQGTSTPIHFTVDENDALSIDAARFEIVFQLVTLGNEDFAFGDQLSVYPNPVNGDVLNISVGRLIEGEIELTLFNTLGQQVISKSVDSVSNGVITLTNLSRLESGLYILNVSNGLNTVTRKVILD